MRIGVGVGGIKRQNMSMLLRLYYVVVCYVKTCAEVIGRLPGTTLQGPYPLCCVPFLSVPSMSSIYVAQ